VLSAAARTHPGRVRLNNEDLPVLDAARGVFAVIDGIGGQAGGEVAAATARDVILQRLARPTGTAAERVREAIAIANNEIFRRAAASAELGGMGCVITLAIVADGRLTIGHVGDTRLYKIRPDGIRKLTRDHSPVGELEDAGELAEPEAMRHPRRHEVFRDIGTVYRDKDEREFVDVIEEPLEPDAAILLCSDGLSDMLPAATIAHIVRQHTGSPERVVEALVAAANDAGGRDNITVVYAEMPLLTGRPGRTAAETLTPTEAMGVMDEPAAIKAAPASASPGRVRRAMQAINASRGVWFVFGALLGVVGALGLAAYVATTQVRTPQTLVVSLDGSAPFTTITAAVAASHPGDIVRAGTGHLPRARRHERRRRPRRASPRHRHDRRPAGVRRTRVVAERPVQRESGRNQDRRREPPRHRRPRRRAGRDAGARRDHRGHAPRHRSLPWLDPRRPRQPHRDPRNGAGAP
jgi:serine/threonine protein phosphatase PrpC